MLHDLRTPLRKKHAIGEELDMSVKKQLTREVLVDCYVALIRKVFKDWVTCEESALKVEFQVEPTRKE